MLGKLIKHEFKSTYKTYMMLYVGVLVLSLLNAFTVDISTSNPFLKLVQVLLMVAYVFGASSVVIITTVFIIRRFYMHLFKDEGYLAHTLPVKPWGHIVAKALASYVWLLASGVVVMLSVGVLFIKTPYFNDIFKAAKEAFKILSQNGNIAWFVVETLIAGMFAMAFMVIFMYASIAIGQLWSSHRVIGAFVAYVVLYFVNQFVTGFVIASIDLDLSSQKYTLVYDSVKGTFEMPSEYSMIMWTTIGINLALGIIYFYITQRILKKKINLE